MRLCKWDYCRAKIPKYCKYCTDHRDMKWWEEYEEHAKHLCWEEEEIPLDDFEDVLDLIHECRESGGPMDAALRIEREHGVNPAIFGERFETVK
jgi:hypothetical protein